MAAWAHKFQYVHGRETVPLHHIRYGPEQRSEDQDFARGEGGTNVHTPLKLQSISVKHAAVAPWATKNDIRTANVCMAVDGEHALP
jgi:hypothetical protein